MARYIVTVKLPKNPQHDPGNKKSGRCPVNYGICTDVTGEHHSYLEEAGSAEEAMALAATKYEHITRIELAGG